MLVFGVGDLLWVVFFTGKMKHQFSWAQLFIGMLSCRVCQNPGSQWVKSTRKSIRLLLYKGNPFLSFRNSTVNQFLGRRYISNVPPWFLLHWYVSRHRHRCPRGICNSYEWIIYGRLKGFGNMSSSSNMGSWRVPGLFIIPCLVRIYKRSSTPKSCDLGGGVRVKMDSRSASLKMSTDRYLSRKQSQAQGAKTQITINHMYFSRWWFQTFALFTRIPGEYFSNGWFKHQLVFVTCYTSSARTSRGRKFPKGKELYSTERICL